MEGLRLVVEDATIRREDTIVAFLDVDARGRVTKLIVSPDTTPGEREQIFKVTIAHSLLLKAGKTPLPVEVIIEQLDGLSLRELETVATKEGVEVVNKAAGLFETIAQERGKKSKP